MTFVVSETNWSDETTGEPVVTTVRLINHDRCRALDAESVEGRDHG